jgi:hypothetical protein
MSISVSILCDPNQDKIPAQTLFLGASVVSFNANMGWGGQPSQLTVNLVEDSSCIGNAFPNSSLSYKDNHYHDCVGNDCYEDELGHHPFDPERNLSETPLTSTIYPKRKLVPGKVYYQWNNSLGKFVSKYWKDADPGFFGIGTKIGPNGEYNPTGPTYTYDLINTPVFFKMGEFYYEGLIQSWEQDVGTGGKTYRVTIESVDTLLSQCWIILGDYAGSIFNLTSGSIYGGPTNYASGGLTTTGTIAQGNLPNIFNVYGFLESFGYNNFGGSKINDNGMRYQDIVDALSVLTSAVSAGVTPDNILQGAHQFSPFGRIMFRTAQVLDDSRTFVQPSISTHSMGIIPPIHDSNGISRSFFTLDLSELPTAPDMYRISGNVMSIMDFIRKVTEDLGYDFYFSMLSGSDNNQIINVIKLRTIYRGLQPSTNQIQKTIESLKNQGYNITSSTFGREKNDSSVRTLYIGEKQQRLYQVKNYRLAYNQTNYIYNPATATFVDYNRFDKNSNIGKVKIPSAFSTRNPDLSKAINGQMINALFNREEDIKNHILNDTFGKNDPNWVDNEISSGATDTVTVGNYASTQKINNTNNTGVSRYYPLYRDVISPFFGYQFEDIVTVSSSPQDNVFRYVRPVWLDKWTGQIMIINNLEEIPRHLSRNLNSLYNDNHFKISETEIRAAMASAENYLLYCMGKVYKPDLFLMLVNAYKRDGINIFITEYDEQETTHTGTHYGVGAANCAGPFGYPAEPRPQIGDNLNINMDFMLHPLFFKDVTALAEFISSIGNKYYGKQYLVKIPEITSYQDDQFFDIQYPHSSDAVKVFKGSGKIFYNYEPTNDGAWEEYGNIIDDSILIGSADWHILSDDNGKIKPIVGYNATDSLDYIAKNLCAFDLANNTSDVTKLKTWDGDAYSVTRYSLSKYLQAVTNGACNAYNFLFPSLNVSSLDPGTYVVKEKNYNITDTYGNTTLGNSKKLYATTSIEEKIVFLNPKQLQEPRVIINALDLQLNSTSLSYSKDPNRTILANIAIEDLSIYLKSIPNASLIDTNYVQYMLNYVSPIMGNQFLLNSFVSNQSASHAILKEKAAHPFFAAIPVKSNQHRYGPWTNYPDLIKETIFPDVSTEGLNNSVENLVGGVKVEVKTDFSPWNFGGMSLLDQEVINEINANVNYQQVLETAQVDMPGLPIFGLGAKFSSTTNSFTSNIRTISFVDVKYLQQNFDIPIIGNPVSIPTELIEPQINTQNFNYNVYSLIASDQNFNEPVITNIQVNVGSQINTTYNFRTYIRKLGFFNKETTDKLKQAAISSIKTNKIINTSSTQFLNLLNKQKQEIINKLDSNTSIKNSDLNSKLFATSPTEVLVGMAQPFISPPNLRQLQQYFAIVAAIEKRIDAINGKVGQDKLLQRLQQLQQQAVSLVYGADYGDDASKDRKFKDNDGNNGINALKDTLRFNTSVFLYPAKELPAELQYQYSQKSMMSLDGIFSPISFYPTYSLSTYFLTKYDTVECPYCKGVGSIDDTAYNFYSFPPKKIKTSFFCLYCTEKKVAASISKTVKSSTSNETLPPYIITNGTDISILLNKFNSGIGNTNLSSSSSVGNEIVPINMYSLQPIVVPYGDFRNPNVQQSGNYFDRCRHSIKVVARGDAPPSKYRTFNIANNLTKYFIPDNGELQTNSGYGVNADYYYRNIEENHNLANQRFLGLRGPLVMHGWGYDTEGYPVPNAADEPYSVDNYGNPLRFKLKITENDPIQNPKKYKDLEIGDLFRLPNETTVYTKTDSLLIRSDTTNNKFRQPYDDMEIIQVIYENDMTLQGEYNRAQGKLGDIIGKFQAWDPVAKRYPDKVKQKQFYLNWAERPDLWPVGPIDLRWDDNRKVWCANQPSNVYKMVYITLEEDLIKEEDYDESYPARGFLDEIEYSSEPLPNGFRRLVYVKDRSGYTAPRGAKLLCRYDQSSGFYEPVSKPSFICMGIITGTNATITMAYVQGKKKGEIPTMVMPYDNPLNLTFNANNGTKGMFTYIGNKWTLSSVQQ